MSKLAKIIWGSTVLVALLFVTALVVNTTKNNSKSNEVINAEVLEPSIVNEYGAVLVTDKGVSTEGNKDDLTELHLYFDPICPGCGYLDQTLSPTFNELLNNKEVVMYITPLSFLDGASKDEYSSRMVSALMTVGEESPEHFLPFMNRVFLSQPQEGSNYQTVSNQDFVEMAIEVGVPKEAAEKILLEQYKEWAKVNTNKVAMTQNDVFPNGISTPAVFINLRDENGKVVATALDFQTEQSLDEYLIEQIKKQ